MTTDPRMSLTQGRRWALWLFMLAGVVLHACLCPPDVHAGVLAATTRTCVAPAAGTPPTVGSAQAPAPGRVGDATRPCVPVPRPHHHAPCLVMSHRGFSHERSTGPWPADALPGCPLPAPYAGDGGGSGACARGHAPWRSGADLLIGLCSSRT